MPRLIRIRRLIGVLQQMLDVVRARTVPRAEPTEDDEYASGRQQRVHVEWLCDHDINAFRIYTHANMSSSRVVPLSSIPHSLTWGFDNRDQDTLYYGSRPFVFYMPGKVTYITVEDELPGDLRLVVELTPLALQDVVALDFLEAFSRPVNTEFPRKIVMNSILSVDDEFSIPDNSFAFHDDTVNWTDVLIDDYLIVEVSVYRVFNTPRSWGLHYRLQDAARIATDP